MSFPTQYTVVVPAAGIGSRMRSARPKQYLTIAGKSIIEHTLNNLLTHTQIKSIVVVLHPEDETFKQLPIANDPKVEMVVGGKERSDSVLAGLNHLSDDKQWVLVHDAARPCLQHKDLTALLSLAEQGYDGGILATPVRDTMKRSIPIIGQQSKVSHTESRDNLWHALTPQFFPLGCLKHALIKAQKQGAEVTDEASAIEYVGGNVLLVEGLASNIKVTQPEDLLLAEFYLSQNKV